MNILNCHCEAKVACLVRLLVPDGEGQVATAHLRIAIYDDLRAEQGDNFVCQLLPNFPMSHLATTKDYHDLYAVAVIKEFLDFANFYIEVIFPNFQPKSDLAQFATFGFFLGFAKLFHLLVLEFAPIDDLDYGRVGVCGDLYKIDTSVSCHELSVATRHNA